MNDKGDSEDFTGPDGSRMKISGTIRNAKLQIGDLNFQLDVLYVTPELHSFFIMGADIFHEDRIYRTGINDKLKHLTLAMDDPDPSIG